MVVMVEKRRSLMKLFDEVEMDKRITAVMKAVDGLRNVEVLGVLESVKVCMLARTAQVVAIAAAGGKVGVRTQRRRR